MCETVATSPGGVDSVFDASAGACLWGSFFVGDFSFVLTSLLRTVSMEVPFKLRVDSFGA